MGNVSPLNSLFEILKKLKYFWKYWNKFKVLFKTPTTSTGKIWVHERVYLKLFSEISADVRTYILVLCQQLTIPLLRNLRTICWNFLSQKFGLPCKIANIHNISVWQISLLLRRISKIETGKKENIMWLVDVKRYQTIT